VGWQALGRTTEARGMFLQCWGEILTDITRMRITYPKSHILQNRLQLEGNEYLTLGANHWSFADWLPFRDEAWTATSRTPRSMSLGRRNILSASRQVKKRPPKESERVKSYIFLAGIETNTGLLLVYIHMNFYRFIGHFC
jgi:hypothetical protein